MPDLPLCNIKKYENFLAKIRELSYINTTNALLACFSI
ncbi:hypothetical protein BJ917_4087 [Pseudomonas sp. WPR_5_2]|nr:hypothetical protein BJ917_4087 [Pseudomonas sp. WPR_5_2]